MMEMMSMSTNTSVMISWVQRRLEGFESDVSFLIRYSCLRTISILFVSSILSKPPLQPEGVNRLLFYILP